MNLALILDVDGVLTDTPVNLQIAKLLNIESKFKTIEDQFNAHILTNEQFNRLMIPMFNESGFSKKFMTDNFDNINIREGIQSLLELVNETYLVSSGPDYYINMLTDKFNIDKNRVLCSTYDFYQDGRLSKAIRGVSSRMKSDFVKDKKNLYDIIIGVGDNPSQDTQFLEHCNIRIIMGSKPTRAYLCANDFDSISDLINCFRDNIQSPYSYVSKSLIECKNGIERFLIDKNIDNNVFIITPYKDNPAYELLEISIKDVLKEHNLQAIYAKDYSVDDQRQLWKNLQCIMLGCKYAIAIYPGNDDRNKSSEVNYNPNVALEIGYMLSRGKKVLVLKDTNLPNLPSDMLGTLYIPFDMGHPRETARKAIEEWLRKEKITAKGTP